MKPIAQREARRLRKRVRELEERIAGMTRTWGGEYPGQHIDTLTVSEVETAIIQTAMRLGHPVVFKHARDREFYVYAARK